MLKKTDRSCVMKYVVTFGILEGEGVNEQRELKCKINKWIILKTEDNAILKCV